MWQFIIIGIILIFLSGFIIYKGEKIAILTVLYGIAMIAIPLLEHYKII